ncbi:glutathione S-transferase family protein [Massilia sp. TSP1-1-2]|uniref:glutathione S-transferase family protein n=1 Tax=Massilia sp. TSP1-1-2 TaxID=2804649 RepID=UPI003CE69BDF
MSPTLYYHPLASYCHKVLVALYELGTAFEPRLIDLGNDADRAALRALWPMMKFPVLNEHARGRTVAESSVIIEYLDHHHAAPHILIPRQWEAALDVCLWDRVFDHHVQGPMQEIVLDRLRAAGGDLPAQRAALGSAYHMIDERMAGRTWVGADAFSMADCAAAPALFYAGTVQPFPDACVQLRAYFDRLMARPSVARVLEQAKPYFGMYPFAEAIPGAFR